MASKKKKTKKRERESQAAAETAPLRQPVTKSNRRVIDALVNKINTKYGEGSPAIITASRVVDNSHIRRPCGIAQLDLDTGGGLPAQSFVTLGGPPNAGKSTLLYCYCAYHQKIYGSESNIAISCPEGGIDYIQAHRMGWKVPAPAQFIEDEQRHRAQSGLPPLSDSEITELTEEVGTNLLFYGDCMEDTMDIALDILATNAFGILAIDSYDSMIPRAEAALDSLQDNAQQALRANIITRAMQRYGRVKRNPAHRTTFVMTTQVRSNRKKTELPGPMQKYAKDWSDDKSAYALQHWRDMHIIISSGEKMREGNKTGGPVLGKMVNWDIQKGKKGAHDNKHGSTPYYYDDRAFGYLGTLIPAGLQLGVIRETEGKLSLLRHGAPDERLHKLGKIKFLQELLARPDYEWIIKDELALAAGVSSIYYPQ